MFGRMWGFNKALIQKQRLHNMNFLCRKVFKGQWNINFLMFPNNVSSLENITVKKLTINDVFH